MNVKKYSGLNSGQVSLFVAKPLEANGYRRDYSFGRVRQTSLALGYALVPNVSDFALYFQQAPLRSPHTPRPGRRVHSA